MNTTGIQPLTLVGEQDFLAECDCGVSPPRREIDRGYASNWRNHDSNYRSPSGECPFHAKQHAACMTNAIEYERYDTECKAAIHAGVHDPEVIKYIFDHSRRYGDMTRFVNYLLRLLEQS